MTVLITVAMIQRQIKQGESSFLMGAWMNSDRTVEIKKMSGMGYTVKGMANYFGLDREVMYQKLRRANMLMLATLEKPPSSINWKKEKRSIKERLKTECVRSVGKTYGLDRITMHNVLKTLGISANKQKLILKRESTMSSIKLKVGRHEYNITEDDVFMNNGNGVVLMTQSKERLDWGRRASPWLSMRAIREISAYHSTPEPERYKSIRFKLTLTSKDNKS